MEGGGGREARAVVFRLYLFRFAQIGLKMGVGWENGIIFINYDFLCNLQN